jgi:hypothetical protein
MMAFVSQRPDPQAELRFARSAGKTVAKSAGWFVPPVLLLDNQTDTLQDRDFHARFSTHQRHGGRGP